MHRFGLFKSSSTRRSLTCLRTEQKSDSVDPEDPPFGPAKDQSFFPLAQPRTPHPPLAHRQAFKASDFDGAIQTEGPPAMAGLAHGWFR